MTLKVKILCFLMLAIVGVTFGQKGKKFNKSKKAQPSDYELLDQARSIHIDKPSEAIAILDRILNKKSKKRDVQLQSNAYALLGDINNNIGQVELALSRYQQALHALEKTKYIQEKKRLFLKIGEVYVKKEDAVNARSSFQNCIEIKQDRVLSQLCEEGLADVELLLGNVQETFSQIQNVESNYAIDSLTTARLEAKKSRGYSQTKDLANASRTLQNSMNSLPSKISKEDYKDIEMAKEEILEIDNVSNVDKIDVRKNTLPTIERMEVLAEIAVRENLEVASLYEEENNLDDALVFIKRSKEAIDNNTSAIYVAEVYRKSAEINQKRGALNTAVADFEKYIEAKETAIEDLKKELNRNVAIVKGQQKIDIGEKDFNLQEKEGELLQSQVSSQRWVIGLLSLLLGGSLVFFYFINKNVKAKRKANQLLLLKSLRTQMNPHFIFNALNSVNNFIAKNDEKAANKFLAEFSRLMRKVLDHSQKDLVSFEEEMELNELYLKLEHFRFRDKFDYQFEKNINVNTYDLEVPPMLIQPFIENAVWHGLRYKEGQGNLKVAINEEKSNLIVTIEDNGIGRTRSKDLKTTNQKKYKSTGLNNVSQRIELINKVYKKNYEISINDANTSTNDVGTIVSIKIPIEKS